MRASQALKGLRGMGTALAWVWASSFAVPGFAAASVSSVPKPLTSAASRMPLAVPSHVSIASLSKDVRLASSLPLSFTPKSFARPPFLKSTARLLGTYGSSPLHLNAWDLAWLAPSVAATWVTLHNDVPLYDALAKGGARKAWLDHSMPTVSALGDGLTEAGLVAVASQLGPPRLQRTSVVALQALFVAGVYGELFKVAAWSNRPYENDTYHHFWDFGQATQGMPSGHSFSAFAVAEVYGAEYGREWTYPAAALIAYSRVYNQDHWPSDVLVGSLLGIAAGIQARHTAAHFGVPGLSFGLTATDRDTPEGVLRAHF
ncbi:MAG: phosphatase PAP2 family protein [bacterium]